MWGLWIFVLWSVPTSGVPQLLEKGSSGSFPWSLFALAVWEKNPPVKCPKVRLNLATDSRYWLWPVPCVDFHVQKGGERAGRTRGSRSHPWWPQTTKGSTAGPRAHWTATPTARASTLPLAHCCQPFYHYHPVMRFFRHFFPNHLPFREIFIAQVCWRSVPVLCVYSCFAGDFCPFPRSHFCPCWKCTSSLLWRASWTGCDLKTEPWCGIFL